MFESSHRDSPGLWAMVALGSLIIHGLFLWFLLGLFLPNRARGNQRSTIPIEIIAVNANQSPVEIPKAIVKRQVATTPKTATNNKPIPTTTPQTNQSPPTPTPSPTPTPTPSPQITPSPSPTPTPTPGESPDSRQGDEGFRVNVRRFVRAGTNVDHPGQEVDTIDIPATIQPNYQTIFDNLNLSGVNTQQALTFEVVIEVKENGKAIVVHELGSPVKVQQGNISEDAARALATEIIKNWVFNPTIVAGGPIPFTYDLQLSTSPL